MCIIHMSCIYRMWYIHHVGILFSPGSVKIHMLATKLKQLSKGKPTVWEDFCCKRLSDKVIYNFILPPKLDSCAIPKTQLSLATGDDDAIMRLHVVPCFCSEGTGTRPIR